MMPPGMPPQGPPIDPQMLAQMLMAQGQSAGQAQQGIPGMPSDPSQAGMQVGVPPGGIPGIPPEAMPTSPLMAPGQQPGQIVDPSGPPQQLQPVQSGNDMLAQRAIASSIKGEALDPRYAGVRSQPQPQGPVPLYGGQGAPMGPPGMRRF